MVHWCVTAIVLCLAGTASASQPAGVTVEIEYLLAYVQQSECLFIRNGDPHAPDNAAAHIRKKYEHFKKKIATTDDFIKRSATGSLMSGKPYQVKCPPDNQLVATADWLRGALKAYRATAANP